jgi:hypothetical protein
MSVVATFTNSLWSQLVGREREAVIGRPDDGRLPHKFAMVLQRDFINNGRLPREMIGTLADIRHRFGFGRCTCREAIGILEMRGWLATRWRPWRNNCCARLRHIRTNSS